MENDNNTLFRAIIPFMMWDPDASYPENEMPPIWRWGSCFFVQCDEDFYAVTSKHCLANVDPKHIFLALPNNKMKSIPISKVIFSNYNDGLNTDTDIVLMKVAVLDALIAKAKPGTEHLAQNILNMPYVKKWIKKNKHRNPKVAIKEIMESSFYQNVKKHQEKDVLKLVNEVYTEDLKFCVFKLNEKHDLKDGDVCVSLGIPNSDFNINHEEKTIHSLILETECKFIGFDTIRQDYVFECDNVEDLDGVSGGPILFEDTVIAVQHSVEKGKIYATPLTKEFIINADKS